MREPEPAKKELRTAGQPQQPTQIEPICPLGDASLISRDETKRGSDAVNRPSLRSILSKKPAELFLGTGAEADHDVRGVLLVEHSEQLIVLNRQSEHRRDVAAFCRDGEAFRTGPGQQSLPGAFVRQNPKRLPGLEGWGGEQLPEITKTRNSPELASPQDTPEQNHEAAVRQDQISRQDGAAIIGVELKSLEACSRGSNEKAALFRHQGYRFGRCAVEEMNPENLFE